ncbi:MAG: acyl carrier protein [Eubacterium sp.]|nr:acyl carrier protein [Eubacterium sp.]
MLEQLKNILFEYTGIENLKIDENTNLKNDLGLNSLDLANLACEVEDEFDIEIPDIALKDIKTVGDVISFIENAV